MLTLRKAPLAAFILAISLFTGSASAGTTHTWTGGGTTTNWSEAANWTGGAPIASGDVIFNNNVKTTSVNDLAADLVLNSISFSTGAGTGAFTFTGNRITLGGNITNNSANLQTINFDMILTGTRTINTASGSIILGGIISGGAGLTKTGTNNTLTLSGTNTYSGTTTLTTGIIRAQNSSALGTGTFVFGGGQRLELTDMVNIANSITFNSGGLTGRGAFEQVSGTGTLSGPITLNAATVAGNHFGSAAGTLVVSGVITSSVPVGVRVGTVVLSGGGTGYSAITINEGTLRLGATNGIPTATNLDIAITANGVFDLNGFNQTLSMIRRSAGAGTATVTSSTGTPTLTLNLATATTLPGPMTGSLEFVKNGVGTFTISGASTYSGATTINDGILKAGVANAFSANSAYSVANLATAGLDITGFNTSVGSLSGGGALGGNVTLGTQTLTMGANNSTTTFSGNLTGTATASITKAGTGSLTLTGNNAIPGTLTISGGTLVVGTATAIAPGPTTLTMSGTGTLDLNGFDLTVGTFSASATTNTITDNSAVAGTTLLTINGMGGTINTRVFDGTTRSIALRIANNISTFSGDTFANNPNTFSGGLTMLHNAAGGTRLQLGTLTTVGAAGAITSSPVGRGPITLGQLSTDKVGVFFNVANQTLLNDIVLNTSLGNDRVGIRNDVLGSVIAGKITTNASAPAIFNSGANASLAITGQITGAAGLSIEDSGFAHFIALNNAGTPNNFLGNVSLGGANCSLGVLRADQIPDTASVALSAGTFFATAPAGIDVIESIGALTFSGNASMFLSSSNSKAQLNTASLTRIGGAGTLTLTRNFTTGQANLFIAPGAGDPTEPAEGSAVPFVRVNDPSLSGVGYYSRATDATGGVTAFLPVSGNVFTFTSVTSGNWDAPSTWTRTGNGAGNPTTPGAADYVVISANHTINLNGADRTALAVNFAPNPVNQTSSIVGSNMLTVATGSVSVNPGNAAVGTGLLGEYYNSTNFNFGPILSRVENINQPNVTTDPDGAGPLANNTFSTVWTGFVQPDFTETYTFGMASDDGFRMYVNNQLLAESWQGQGFGAAVTGSISLIAGTKYPVRIEYYQGTGGNAWVFSWSSASQTAGVQTVVPVTSLFPSSSPVSIGCNLNFGAIPGVINNASASVLSINGVVQGSAGIEILSNNAVAFSATNTFTGGTRVRSGILQVGSGSALSSGTVTMEAKSGISGVLGTAIQAISIPNTIQANGDFFVYNSGVNLNFAGPLELLGSYTVSFVNNTFALNPAFGAVTLSGGITDGGNNFNFTKAGGGGLTITGTAFTHGGTTTLARGIVNLGASNILRTDRALILNGSAVALLGATLNLNGFDQTLSGLSINPGSANNIVTSTPTAATLTLNVPSGTSTYTGVISGQATLAKSGAGTFALGGANSYLGQTQVQAGTLQLAANNVIPDASIVVVDTGATLNTSTFGDTIGAPGRLVFNGGTLAGSGTMAIGPNAGDDIVVTAAGGTITAPISFAGTREVNVASGGLLNIDAAISGAGGLTKIGAGTVLLQRVNPYTGATTVNEGVLQLNGNVATIAVSTPINLNGGTFFVDETPGTANPNRIGNGIAVNFNGGTFSMVAANNITRTETVGTVTFSGSPSTISLTPSGAFFADLTFTGAAPSRTPGATYNFIKGAATPGLARLFFSAGVDGTQDPFATVNGNPSIYSAVQGLIETTITTVITDSDGDWGTSNTAFPGDTLPPAGAHIIIRHAVTVSAAVSAASITYDLQVGGPPGLTAATPQTVTITTGKIATSGSVAPVINPNISTSFGGVAGVLQINSSGLFTANGPFINATGLSKSGTGNALLTNPNSTYSGSTNILNGTLIVTADTSTATDGILGINTNGVNLAGGTFRTNGTFTTARPFTISSAAPSNSIDIGTGNTLTLSTALAGNNPLRINSDPTLVGTAGGTLELLLNSARTGTSTINGGTVQIKSTTTANTGFGSGAITINEGTLEYNSAGVASETLPNPLVLNDKATLRGTGVMATTSFTNSTLFIAAGAKINIQTGATSTDVFRLFSGVNQLSGGGSGSTITISGAGRVQFMQDNANQLYRGDYIVNSGMFAVNNANSVSNTANLITINATGTFTSNVAATFPNPFVLNGGTLGVNSGAGVWSGNVSVTAPSNLSTSGLGGTSQNATFSGILSGSSPLSIVGNGSTILLTNPANTFSGNIVINAGANFVNPPATTVTNSAALQFQPANLPAVSGPPATVVFSGSGAGVVNFRSDVPTVFSTSVLLSSANGTVSVDRQATGIAQTLTLNALTLTNDTLNVTGGNTYNLAFSGTTTLNGTAATARFNPTTAPLRFTGPIVEPAAAGNGFTLNNTATSTVTFAGSSANTYTGTTTINGGTLILNKTAGVNAIAGNISVGDGTGADTLRLLAANQIVDTAALTSNVVSGRIELNGSETIASLADAGTGAVASTLLTGTTPGGVLTLGGSNVSTTFSGVISQTGGITKVGTGTLILAGSNTYTGTLTITDGVIQAGNNNALGTGGLLMTGGLLNLNTFSPTVTSLAGAAGTITDNAAGTGTSSLTINQASSTAFNGTIQDGTTRSLALVKSGVGMLTLGSANTYSSSTSVNAGTLLVANSTGSATGTSLITVAASGALGGTGTVNGPVGVTGSITPGIGGVGTLTVLSNVTLNSGASFAVDILNATSDQLVVGGNVTLAANVALNATATTPVHGAVFSIIQKSGAVPVTGTFNGLVENTVIPISGNPFVIRYVSGDGNDIVLVANDIPVFTAAATNTSQAVDEGQSLAALLATDSDSDPLTFTLFSGALPTGVSLATNGTFTGSPNFGTAGNYTVVVQATDPSGSFARTTLGITVNGVTLTVSSVLVAEAAGSVDVTITRSGLGNQVVTVQAATANGSATAGQDYTAVTVPVSFPIGVFTQIVTIPILDDGTSESLENFTVGLSSAVNASIAPPGTGTVTIIDDETPPTLAIAQTTVNEGAGTATISVTLTGASALTITVNYNTANIVAVAGVDFTATSGVLTYLPGETGVKTFTVPIINDLIDENDESFTVTLSNISANASITQASASVIIVDNDLPPLAVADSVVVGQSIATTINVLTNDTGLANLPVRVSIFFGPANGVVVANSDNTVTYTPNANFSGIDSFIYRITDATNQTTNATVTVDVRPGPSFTSPPTLTPNPALAGQLITGTAAFSAGSISWNWGDGSPLETSANVSHTYPEPGVYNVITTLTSPEGVQTVIQTQVFIGLGFGDGSGGGGGGGANPPGVSGILVGATGAGKLQGGSGKLAISFKSPERTTFSGSLGMLSIPATVTQTTLSGQLGKLVVGTGATAAQFPFTLGKTGKAKAAGLTSFEFSVKKKRLKFTVRRSELTAIFESLGAVRQSPVDKTKVINLLIPVTVQIGDKIFVAMTFAIKYKQTNTTSGKGAL